MLKTLLVTLTRHAKASVQKNKRGEEVTEAAIAMLLIIELYLKMPAGINKSNNELLLDIRQHLRCNTFYIFVYNT